MDFLIGQPRVTVALQHALQRDRLGHGLLFLGESGVGRERAALGLASALLCERQGAPGALPWGCGSCDACRRARAGSHPDLHLVMSEAEAVRRGRAAPDGKRRPSPDILVDAMRELAGRLRLAAYQGGYRVAIVLDAHRMNTSAQNALLKTLEEPGERTVVILLAPHARAVLPTIASRCLRLVFAPLAEGGVRALAADLKPSGAAAGGAAAGGTVGVLWDALVGPDGAGGNLAARLDAAEASGKERSDVDQALDQLEERLATCARSGAAGSAVPLPWQAATELLERVGQTRAAIAHNASLQLAIEELLLAPALASKARGR